MSVFLRMSHDGITIYEDVTHQEHLFQFIKNIVHEHFKGPKGPDPEGQDSEEVVIELDIFYENRKITIKL